MPTLYLAYRLKESECRYANLNEGKWPNRLPPDELDSVELFQEAFDRAISKKSSLSPDKLSIEHYKAQIEQKDVRDLGTDPLDWTAWKKAYRDA